MAVRSSINTQYAPGQNPYDTYVGLDSAAESIDADIARSQLAQERGEQKRLRELKLIDAPEYKPLEVGADAYWKGVKDVKTITDNDLDELYDYHLEIIGGSTDTYSSDEMIVTDEKHFSNSTNMLSAIDREREERSKLVLL